MADSRLILKQRRDAAMYEQTIRQLEALVLEYRELLQDACNVACGFAMDVGFGNKIQTNAELFAEIREQLKQEEAASKMNEVLARTGKGGP